MMPSLDDRVAALERSLRRQRVFTAAAAALALVAIAMVAAGKTSGQLRARAFHLVNSDGEMLAQLGITPRGAPFLKFHVPENGGSVMVGSLGEDLAGFAVIAGDDRTILNASTDKSGNPSLSLTDKGRKAMLSVGAEHAPTLLMLGPGMLAASSKHLWLKDSSGRTVFSTAPGGRPPVEEKAP